ncbi:unannotated protein [freshwater metagenome]|uniref:Unannotated protein n=2 Tax=freshwater metagenome TaxID=449393 RepID=A0A6J7FLN5_9ZZZZ|nr:thiol reductant ABC exporter subunit CydD [Actinomycetota bacterium]
MKPLDPRLLRYSRSSRGFILSTVAISVAMAVLTLIQAFYIASIIVAIFQKQAGFSLSDSRILILLALFIGRAALNFSSEWLSALASTKIRTELRTKLLHKALSDGSTTSHEMGSAQLSVLASTGINNLDAYFSKFLPQLFIAGVVPVMVGISITIADWKSGVIVLLTIPLIPLFGILIGRFTATATAQKWETMGVLSGHFLDLLSGLTTLKVYGRAHKQEEKIRAVGNSYRTETMSVLRISFLSSLALELVATLSVALIAVAIGLRLVGGSLTLFTGLLVLILAPEVYWPIRQVASYFHAASDGMEVFRQIYEVLERPTRLGKIEVEEITAISWSELTVQYPERATVKIPAGQLSKGAVHAVIGASGSGKSTLINILMGFTSPTSGDVLISTNQGTFSITELDVDSLRKNIAWMPQEPKFPYATIKQVLLHAKPEATQIELESVLESVGLELRDLSNGLSTILGTLTQPLSIGQLRKIALARAVLKGAQVLLIDEPSASVDDTSEEIIDALLHREAALGKLVLVVSHRPLLAVHADAQTDMSRLPRSARMA